MSSDIHSVIRPHNVEELLEKAKAIYVEIQEREDIEKHHAGEYIAIDVDSKRYFINGTRDDAVHDARKELPDAIFFVKRIGGVDTVARNYPFPVRLNSMHARLL